MRISKKPSSGRRSNIAAREAPVVKRAESRARKSSSAPVRLADVARYAGVSTASVSRAINDPQLVSAELRERVTNAAQILNWVPNGAAKALASLHSRTVGAIIPNLGNPNFSTLIESLQRELSKANYTLILGCAESRATDLRAQLGRKMIERGIDCLVLVGEAQPTALLELLKSQGVPCVITFTSGTSQSTTMSGPDVPGGPSSAASTCIGFDNHLAASRITRHLLDLGHRRFGLIAERAEWNDRIQQRIAGVNETLAQAGLGIKPHHFAEVDTARRIASGRAGFAQVMADKADRPTAVICSNDYLAFGVLIEAAAMKIRVPKDVSVTGFDDIDQSAHVVPSLTTIRVPAAQMGEEIARYVVQFLDKGSALIPPPIEAEFVVRDSTAPPSTPSTADKR